MSSRLCIATPKRAAIEQRRICGVVGVRGDILAMNVHGVRWYCIYIKKKINPRLCFSPKHVLNTHNRHTDTIVKRNYAGATRHMSIRKMLDRLDNKIRGTYEKNYL